MASPSERPPASTVAAASRRVVFGFGVREVGLSLIALGVLALAVAGLNWHSRKNEAAAREVRSELAMEVDAADVYGDEYATLRAKADEIRLWANAQKDEPLRTWARERLHRFDALLAAVDQQPVAQHFTETKAQIDRLLEHGDIDAARRLLLSTPAPRFPLPSELQRMQDALYTGPLAAFSRQNPAYYRALRQFEPEAAKRDEQALRAELQAAGSETVTPQAMLQAELLAAVAAPDDPLVAEWTSLASAIDYFENPDGATLAHWRKAQHALHEQDWGTATAEMQAILNAKVRTRQPFRTAYGRALLKSRPDQPAEAYPYLVEAAGAGDRAARTWVAQTDYKDGRFRQAQRWLEAAADDGDRDGLPVLLDLYANHAAAIDADPKRERGVLERVTQGPDAPPQAWLMLGKLYEEQSPDGTKTAQALACYRRAADKGLAAGQLAVARCALDGLGAPADPDLARDAACAAFAGGEREGAAAILSVLLQQAPERSARAIEQLLSRDSVSSGGGYRETRVLAGPGVTQLKAQLARYLDRIGRFGAAAHFYAGAKDAAAEKRRAELTLSHPCETCGGTGKVQESVPCPSCGGKGRQICSYCGGAGFIYVPGSPPCPTCGGTGTLIQDRKVLACPACGGTGKGKGNVIKQDCPHCDHGYVRCPDCNNGIIVITKECPDCHGRGSWTWADRDQ